MGEEFKTQKECRGETPPAMNPKAARVASEVAVPVVTSFSKAPILTIVLQVLQEQGKVVDPQEARKEALRGVIKEEMTSAWRVISFFVVVFLLPTLLISIPLYARYHIYHAKTFYFTDGDMRSFHGDVSTFWCQGQRLLSNGTFEAYLTKDTKRLKRRTRTTKLSSELLLTLDDIEQWGIHMIQGSQISFSACSRWPGGTLLLVQGEENLRNCFYREERTIHDLSNPLENNAQQKTPKVKFRIEDTDDAGEEGVVEGKEVEDKLMGGKEFGNDDEEDFGGGEVFGNDNQEVLLHQQVLQLHSSNRNQPNSNPTKQHPVSENQSSVETTMKPISGEDIPANKDELVKRNKKRKRINGKKKRRKQKPVKEESPDESEVIMKNESLVTRVRREAPADYLLDKMNMHSIRVNKGSFFFNINDTLDITTGNSSFSSSEEFLRQCSNTIVSIDLSPSPDCKRRTSDPSNKDIRWKFQINETDNYYFIFTSDNSLEANVISFKILLERRLYDVSEALDKCSNISECVFPFSFMKSEGVIVDFNERQLNKSKLENLNNYEITAVCQPRSVVYTVFILLVPFIIILFAFR